MHPSKIAASIILAIVGLLNWGYAALRTFNGAPVEDSLPLMTGGLVCFALIVVFAAQGRKKP
ncbi:hypothetical protein [Synechococcus sp. BA-132 BA5]|uniref:hypothetical protein n=1 Tax=Synechococcus sp. BA-132 BA5 TaxID=3110252 RepID=UPI002B20641D|nr:hypothetical protein [Synechococcus sp. BA-132 BA5]MEA5415467.1 hypothetical protein [Synechococcus sp. BA-132 BA5]